jgi:hypothetical protein
MPKWALRHLLRGTAGGAEPGKSSQEVISEVGGQCSEAEAVEADVMLVVAV